LGLGKNTVGNILKDQAKQQTDKLKQEAEQRAKDQAQKYWQENQDRIKKEAEQKAKNELSKLKGLFK
jgi:vacuolar-type H+-ATPase subunit H